MTALLALIEIAERGENKGVCVTAANAILDRGCGKPTVPVVAADLPPMITLDFGTTLRPPQRDNDSGEQTFLDRTAIQDAGSARRLPVIPPSSDS
jgi:hypothetical protein